MSMSMSMNMNIKMTMIAKYPERIMIMIETGKRTGNGVGPQLSETLERVCVDAEVLVGAAGKGNEQAKRRVAVAQEALDEKMDNIRGAVTMGEKGERRKPIENETNVTPGRATFTRMVCGMIHG